MKAPNPYRENANLLASQYEALDMSFTQEQMSHKFKDCKNLLELGSGSARDLAVMKKKGFEVMGIDGSEAMIGEALDYHPELKGDLVQFDLNDGLPDFDQGFDGVFSIATLIHVRPENLKKLMHNIKSCLKKDGLFFVIVSGKREVMDSRYFNQYNFQQWNELFKEFFEVKEIFQDADLRDRDIDWYTFTLENT
ncbi:MAG: class I SAM-dependent methyltransferase [Flavobacteriaceae bacterium]